MVKSEAQESTSANILGRGSFFILLSAAKKKKK
jgi:hypothetical protein